MRMPIECATAVGAFLVRSVSLSLIHIPLHALPFTISIRFVYSFYLVGCARYMCYPSKNTRCLLLAVFCAPHVHCAHNIIDFNYR